MAPTSHNYGPKCHLAPPLRAPNESGMPPVISQFFYSFLIPIDEPLSSSYHTGRPEKSKLTKQQFQPFGQGDNNMLEKAWASLASEYWIEEHFTARNLQIENSCADEYSEERQRHIQKLVNSLALQHLEQHGRRLGVKTSQTADPAIATNFPACCSSLHSDIVEMLQQKFCSLSRKYRPELNVESLSQNIIDAMRAMDVTDDYRYNKHHRREFSHISANKEGYVGTNVANATHKAARDLDSKNRRFRSPPTVTVPPTEIRNEPETVRLSNLNVDNPGKQFVLVNDASTSSALPQQDPSMSDKLRGESKKYSSTTVPNVSCLELSNSEPRTLCELGDVRHGESNIDVVVGVSRLHKVSLPILHMKPIYWSPINDIAVVLRATWFYRDSMMPVAPVVANQLEAGYQELQPWTETWRDEVRCAIEVGPAGEEKISHCLWLQDSKHYHARALSEPEPKMPSDPFCAARCVRGEAATQGILNTNNSVPAPTLERSNRPFTNYEVIYKDEREAFLLKPALKPSAYYGRRPVSKIAKGITVGLSVVRGFDRYVWDRLNGQKHSVKHTMPCETYPADPVGSAVPPRDCDACQADKDQGQVTDLIFVAHGIGQKIAERVESYHFTHAINGFRRAVNIEMKSPAVQRILRQGQNGVMILPLNWRMGLSFEDSAAIQSEELEKPYQGSFNLKDIEPNTIPAIRSMISDVIFDIPFYMSHHKSKMTNALVSEANKIYRIWCQNNPGFSEKGRVHLIAHSLGSVMAVDILSRQPTAVPAIDLSQSDPETHFLEFDTTNLFLIGSPAGFFLLLEQGALMPRRGRHKPGADARDATDKNIVGETGRFGCLSVDNIYNVLAKEDPIAYLLNGAVDPVYAASLKPAFVPSISTSIFKSMGDAMRQIVPGLSRSPEILTIETERLQALRLPSQLELEDHDFTREEIAEKRTYLLNDNGQIDWYLKSGGGPLEIQYLNMLSAHTSYWINQDFIRMLCIEIGRQPGRTHTLPAFRAVKSTKRFSPGN